VDCINSVNDRLFVCLFSADQEAFEYNLNLHPPVFIPYLTEN